MRVTGDGTISRLNTVRTFEHDDLLKSSQVRFALDLPSSLRLFVADDEDEDEDDGGPALIFSRSHSEYQM